MPTLAEVVWPIQAAMFAAFATWLAFPRVIQTPLGPSTLDVLAESVAEQVRHAVALAAVGGIVVGVATGIAGGHDALSLVLLAVAAAAAVDAVTGRIPDALSFLAGIGAVLAWMKYGYPWMALLSAVAIGLIFTFTYLFGGIGGGDVKLLPAMVLAVATPFDDIGPIVVAVTGMLALVFGTSALEHFVEMVTTEKHVAWREASRQVRARVRFPLGPALLVGGVAASLVVPSLRDYLSFP